MHALPQPAALKRFLVLLAVLWLIDSTEALAKRNQVFPASQLQGCMLDDDPMAWPDVVVKGNRVKLTQGIWWHIGGRTNQEAFSTSLGECGMTEAQSTFDAWRKERSTQRLGLIGGGLTLAVVVPTCAALAAFAQRVTL